MLVQPNTTPPDPHLDEAILVHRARKEPSAFGELYLLHYRPIVSYLFRRTGEYHAAEDLACETFISAYKGIHRYRSRGLPFRAWLYRIATNTANAWAIRRSRVRIVCIDDASGVSPEALAARQPPRASAPGIEDAQAALLTLSPDHQTVLTLHYLEGLSIEDVSAILSCRLGTVKSRLSRARAELKSAIELRRRLHD